MISERSYWNCSSKNFIYVFFTFSFVGDKYRLESSKTSLTFEELVKSIEERQLKDDEQKKLRKLLEEGQGTGKQKQN